MATSDSKHDAACILRGVPARYAPDPPPHVETLADLFEYQAVQRGGAPLFSFCKDGRLVTLSYQDTYHQILCTSARLHQDLQQIKGAVVGIWLERSIELHLAIFSAICAGAAWLPFDADVPSSRVNACIRDSNASVLLCDKAHFEAAQKAVYGTNTKVILWDDLLSASPLRSKQTSRICRPKSPEAAYLIYTSGSLGTPKGIEISHGAALTFSLSERSVLNTTTTDVVWQGFSAAFDMFVEETWVSIAGGAHLMIGSREECQSVSALGGASGLWAKRGVTVVNAVPTLINIMTSLDEDSRLPSSVRLLNLGGEACPPALVDRLWHKDLRIINTYGPSETTVSATYQELFPGQVVTIGKPLPSYHALILPIADDFEEVQTVPKGPYTLKPGIEGELGIGGPCLGKGYIKREELTIEKFIAHPLPSFPGERLYRTGDRVRLDDSLNIMFLGRIDSQVKHRGFRIELGEIESKLSSSHSDVQTAAVILSSTTDRLEAYIVAKSKVEVQLLRKSLSTALPNHMQPEAYFFLSSEEMPRLPSGKINAKALQERSKKIAEIEKEANSKEKSATDELDIDENSTLGLLLNAMSTVFPQSQILPTSDFFDDLGGHSLTAAILVSKLRKGSNSLSSIGLQDIYIYRTAQSLSDKFVNDEKGEEEDCDSTLKEASSINDPSTCPTGRETGEYWPVSNTAFVLCGIAQLPAILFFFFTSSIEFLVPYLVFYVVLHDSNVGYAILAAYGVFVAYPVLFTCLGLLGKWIILGKARPGEYPLYGVYYYRFWLADSFVRLIQLAVFADGPINSFFLKLLWSQKIGNNVVIGQDVILSTSVVERGRLILKRVIIKDNTYIGSNSILEGGSSIQEGGELAPLSMLPDGVTVPAGQLWYGSPAQYKGPSPNIGLEESTQPSFARKALMTLAMAISAWFIFPIFYFAPQIPSMLLFDFANIRHLDEWAQTGVVALPASLGYILLVFIEMITFRWLILGKVKEGSHHTTSIYFFRLWFAERLMAMSLIVLKPVYATIYVVPFMRSLGVKVGDWAEISTARSIQFELTEIGDESFIADNVLMGAPSIRGNQVHLLKTTFQARAFAGNNAIIPQGTNLASNSLVGVLSIAPDCKTNPLQEGQSCFGSPPVLMPARQRDATCHDARLLYNPRADQVALRLLIEGLRIWIPRALIIFALGFALETIEFYFSRIGAVHILLLLPIFYMFLFAIPALVFTVAAKWILIGRYEPAEWPLWSVKVWRSEFVTSVYETLLEPLLTDKLVGTPFLAMCFRLLGVNIGARVTMLSSDITEYDMVTLEDEATINQHAGPQTHLFEDRVMKIGTVHLEKRACMKPYSICLPNSRISYSSQLGSLSLLMKGESIPSNQAWEGVPIAPRKNRKRSPFKQNNVGPCAVNKPESSRSSYQSIVVTSRPRGDGSRSISSNTKASTIVGGDSTLTTVDLEKSSVIAVRYVL